MKILVLSDSHSGLRLMRQSIDTIKPNAVVHLGDCYDDCEALVADYPRIYFYQVPGNWDQYKTIMGAGEVLVTKVCGVNLFMTHGHVHRVRSGLDLLFSDASKHQVQAVLFGHTHRALCYQRDDGVWVLNPGTCACDSGSVGLICVKDRQIIDCRILRQSDLETFT